MATSQIKFTDTAWQQVTGAGTIALMQGIGTHVQVHLSGTAPSASDIGFDLEAGEPVEILNVDLFGGGIWARSTSGRGSVRFAVA